MRTKGWLVLPIMLLLGLFVVACNVPSLGLEPVLDPAATLRATAADPQDIRAPDATLEIGGEAQTSQPGTFCWTEKTDDVRSIGICADAIGIITPWEPLSTTAPVAARVRLAPQETLIELSLQAMRVTPEDELRSSPDSTRAWQPQEGERYPLALNGEAGSELDLEPGLYVLSVWARWENGNDANYGFLVAVGPPAGPGLDKSGRLE